LTELNTATFDDVYQLATPEEIIEDARNGRMYILVDAEDRENEGDLIIPAQFATPDAVNFMAKHGRGLICLAIEEQRADTLGLEPQNKNNGSRFETAFTQSIEAREGVTTGISAADRALTIQVASRMAGLNPSAVICEIMNDDGTMARLPDLIAFAQLHGMKIGTIEDLVAHRLQKDHFVRHIASSDFRSQNGDDF